jgi:hypothetical protein
MSESEKVFKLKKSDIQTIEARMPIHMWRCPICNKLVISVHLAKLIASAKQHLEKTHNLKVKVE